VDVRPQGMVGRAGRAGIGKGMPTRAQVLELLEKGETYATAGQTFGIAPGQAYMIATGRPADGDPDGDQTLVNPRTHNPTRKPQIAAWVRDRARRELTPSEGT
jgi:hypothetical protein